MYLALSVQCEPVRCQKLHVCIHCMTINDKFIIDKKIKIRARKELHVELD